MFEKLISALPFNPGAVQQLSFYAKRVRGEQSVRRIGLIFLVFSFLVQFFAFVSPPVPTLAESPNDLVNGGFSSAAEAANDCTSNLQGYGTMLAYYGITCSDVANASTITINSDQWNKQLWSMGRLPYNLPGETPITIPGLGYPLYARYLWGWDQAGTSSNYQVLNVTKTGGQTFLLMYACGNIASVGIPQPVQQAPNITIQKTTIPNYPEANTDVSPGTTMGYRVYFDNTGSAVTNVAVTDPQPADTTETWMGTGGATTYGFSNGVATWNYSNMPSGASNYYVDVEYQINSNTPNGTQICNTASIKSDQTPAESSGTVCVKVVVNAPPPTPTPPPSPTPQCQQQLSSENESACITTSKSATNVTENIQNANNTTAKAGDVIQYTLSAKNNGSNTTDYVFSDSLAYVLDYATMTNAGGGTVDSNDQISWPGINIGPGQTATKQFEVTVDSPIPSTPASTSDPNYYNMEMYNYFGNSITINLPSTPTQAVQAATTLPNTGPGNSIIIGAAVLAVAGFFFYRSRLVAKEVKIAIVEQSGEL